MYIDTLQKLARSNEWQLIYRHSKEIGSFRLFKNDSDLSKIQITFLYFLSLYNMLYQDLNEKADYLTEEIIKDTLRVEAYLLLRKELKQKKNKSPKQKNVVDSNLGEGSLIFNKRKTGK